MQKTDAFLWFIQQNPGAEGDGASEAGFGVTDRLSSPTASGRHSPSASLSGRRIPTGRPRLSLSSPVDPNGRRSPSPSASGRRSLSSRTHFVSISSPNGRGSTSLSAGGRRNPSPGGRSRSPSALGRRGGSRGVQRGAGASPPAGPTPGDEPSVKQALAAVRAHHLSKQGEDPREIVVPARTVPAVGTHVKLWREGSWCESTVTGVNRAADSILVKLKGSGDVARSLRGAFAGRASKAAKSPAVVKAKCCDCVVVWPLRGGSLLAAAARQSAHNLLRGAGAGRSPPCGPAEQRPKREGRQRERRRQARGSRGGLSLRIPSPEVQRNQQERRFFDGDAEQRKQRDGRGGGRGGGGVEPAGGLEAGAWFPPARDADSGGWSDRCNADDGDGRQPPQSPTSPGRRRRGRRSSLFADAPSEWAAAFPTTVAEARELGLGPGEELCEWVNRPLRSGPVSHGARRLEHQMQREALLKQKHEQAQAQRRELQAMLARKRLDAEATRASAHCRPSSPHAAHRHLQREPPPVQQAALPGSQPRGRSKSVGDQVSIAAAMEDRGSKRRPSSPSRNRRSLPSSLLASRGKHAARPSSCSTNRDGRAYMVVQEYSQHTRLKVATATTSKSGPPRWELGCPDPLGSATRKRKERLLQHYQERQPTDAEAGD